MADNTTELEVLDEIVDVLGGQSGQYETVVPVLQQIKELLATGITDPEAIAEAVAAWLDEHPEATTTVQDGSITGVKIADDTIPDAKLAQTGGVLSKLGAVADVVSNMFDGTYALGYAVLSNGAFSEAAGCVTAILPVNGGETLYIKFSGTHNRLIVAWGTEEKPVGQTVNVVATATDYRPTLCYEAILPSSAKYLYVYVSNQNETPNMYVGKAEVYDLIPYSAPINGDKSAEVAGNLAAHTITALSSQYMINLFDGNYIDGIGALTVGQTESFLYTVVSGSKTIVVPVKPNATYYFRSFDSHNRFRCSLTSDFPLVGDSIPYVADAYPVGTYARTIQTGSSDKWLIITVTNQGDEPRVQITEGADSLVFIGYDSIQPKDSALASRGNWYFLDDVTGTFDADTVASPLDASTTRVADIYAIYDAIVTAHPSYVSKTVLGTVSTDELEMREYVFNSLTVQNSSSYSLKKPKMVFVAGVHGYEQGASYCLAKVLEQIANGTDSISKFVRDNIEIVVVPVANPYGYNHNQRKNENGVDINRNFAAGWSASSDPSSDYYGGSSANSEEETQILTSLLEANDDAYYAIDFHNIASGYPLMYLYSDTQVQFCNSLFVTLTSKWVTDYTGFPTDRLLGYCNTGVSACFSMQALSIGVNSFVAEIPWVMPVIGSTQYDIATLTTGCDVFGNILAMLAKSLI